jgi:uncharacterized membrane protein YphA (DoxX/SURF4 family)
VAHHVGQGAHIHAHLALEGAQTAKGLNRLVLLALAVMVCVGFKTEWSANVLTVVLGLMNIYMYPFWMVHERLMDYYKYYFFQTLSIMGGMLLLSLHGPGGLSLDGQKKGL